MSAPHQRVQLNLTELRQLKWLLGQGLALLSLWTLFDVDFIAGGLVLIAAIIVVVTMIVPRVAGMISGWPYRMVVFALIVFVAMDFLRVASSDLLPPLLRLILGLTVLRCLQYRTRREDLQLVLLTMFICVISGVMTLSLAFALQVLLYTPVAMGLLFLINLLEPVPEQVLDENDWRRFRWRTFLGRVMHGLDFRMMGFASVLFAAVVSVSSIIFITLPRFNLDQSLGFLQMPGVGSIGFSDTVSFGQIRSILDDASSNQVALRVEPPVGVDVPANPYWRMIVLDRYRDGTFSLSPSARGMGGELDNDFRRFGGGRTDSAGDSFWSFFLEGNVSHYLPLPGDFEMVRLERRAKGSLNDPLLVLQLQQTPSSVFGYRVENATDGQRLPATAAERQAFSKLSATDPGSRDVEKFPLTQLSLPTAAADRALLEDIVAEVAADRDFSNTEMATELTRWLQQRFSYSLSEDLSQRANVGQDPLCRWLATGSRGWCEHFAGALVLLLRAADVPARMVVGFNGATVNEYRNYLTVRNRYAHAWVEVFDGDREWVRFDPTPPRDVDSYTGEGLLFASAGWGRSWGAWIDSLRMAWYGNVVAFGQDEQEELVDSMRARTTEFFATLNERLESGFHSFVGWLRSPWNVKRVVQVVATVLVAFTLVALLISSREWLAERFYRTLRSVGVARGSDPVRRKAGRYLRRFYRTAARHSSLPAGWQVCLRQLELIRFGRDQDRPPARAVFARARQVLSAARRGSKPKRISAGMLTPGTNNSADHSGRT